MRAPRRLKDDPAVSEGLREALTQEEEIADDYDLDGLRTRVLAGDAPAGPAVPRGFKWLAVVAVSGFTAAVVTVALQPTAPRVVAPPLAPTIEAVQTGGEPRTPQRTVYVRTDDVDAPEADVVAAVPPPNARAPHEPAAPSAADTPAPAPVEEMHEVAPPPSEPATNPSSTDAPAPPAPSGLAAEIAAYNLGLDAAERREWRAARDAYTRYLADWPQGQMRTEGWLGLLGATVESSSPAAAETLAAQMLDRGGLGSRRADVVLVRAEALVQLGRCDEALGLVEEIRRGSRVNSIKQSCKRARRTE